MVMRDVERSKGESSRDVSMAAFGTKADECDTEYRPVNWKKLLFSPKYITLHIITIAIIVVSIYITVHRDDVVNKLTPFSEALRHIPAGFLIPITILFAISFPPLFGHEIVAPLVGLVYGLWIGFAIVAAGTFLGEIGTWFAFKSLFRKRALKLERTNLIYGTMARMARDGGFGIVLIVRLSAIPSHFSTAVFSACDVRFWHFALATFLALPKQLVLVYLGVLLVAAQQGQADAASNTAKNVVLGATFVVTLLMAAYIWVRMRHVRNVLLREQKERRRERETVRVKEAEVAFGERDSIGEVPVWI